jgi:predicted regulator of Ras-like GTPase activity (Roadblock/LC7/MglB family)
LFHITDELKNLHSFNSIRAVLLFRIDGVIIDSIIDSNDNFNLLNSIKWVKTVIAKVGRELRTALYRIAYSRENEHIYFYKVGSAAILTCILDKFANIGLLSIEMDRIANILEKIID